MGIQENRSDFNYNRKKPTIEIKAKKEEKENEKSKLNNSSMGDIDILSSYKNERNRHLSKKNIVYDSFDDEEAEEESKDFLYFDETSNFIKAYDFWFILSGVYTLYLTPFFLAAYHNLDVGCSIFQVCIELMIDFWNISDIFISLFKSYLNFEEIPVTKLHSIMVHYLSGWFFLDMLAGWPFNSIYSWRSFINTAHTNGNLSTYYNSIVMEIRHFMNWSKAYTSIAMFFTFLHLLTCIFIFIGQIEYPNWISLINIDISKFGHLYIASIYYNCTTIFTVGYGDVVSSNHSERCFNCFLLIFGISIYSWTLSSISTYIHLKQSRHNEFKLKIAVLEQMKRTHKKMPDDLYDRISRFLKYKFKNEKKDKNVIFDCLPIGWRNNLIVEMYKPVINNFVFFRNFPNPDFIIRVILAFRPTINIKYDILVNDGDFVGEMFFVKKGKLTLDVPLPVTVENGYKKSFNEQTNLKTTNTWNTWGRINSNALNFAKHKQGTMMQTAWYGQGTSIKKTLIDGWNYDGLDELYRRHCTRRKSVLNTIEETKRYMKILEIRQNEHFGDVLMFWNQPSPWRLKVKTKICEMFEWNKTDAIEISTSYPEIWRKVNKKSVFNMEQIERLINKALKIFFISNEGEQIKLIANEEQSYSSSRKEKHSQLANIITNNSICELRSIPSNKSVIVEEDSCYSLSEKEDLEEEEKKDENDVSDNSKISNDTNNLNQTDDAKNFLNESNDEETDNYENNINNNNSAKNSTHFSEQTTIKTNIENKQFDNRSLISLKESEVSNTSRLNGIMKDSFRYDYEDNDINEELYPDEAFNLTWKKNTIKLQNFKYGKLEGKNNLRYCQYSDRSENLLFSHCNAKSTHKLKWSQYSISQKESFTIKSKYDNLYLINNYDLEKTKKGISIIKERNKINWLDKEISMSNENMDWQAANNKFDSDSNILNINTGNVRRMNSHFSSRQKMFHNAQTEAHSPGARLHRPDGVKTIWFSPQPQRNEQLKKDENIINKNHNHEQKEFVNGVRVFSKTIEIGDAPKIKRLGTPNNSNLMTWTTLNEKRKPVDDGIERGERRGNIVMRGGNKKNITPILEKKTTLNLVSENIQKSMLNLNNPQAFYQDYFQSIINEQNKKKENQSNVKNPEKVKEAVPNTNPEKT